MASDADGRSWLKYGCGGCLVVVGLVVLAVFGVFGIATLQVGGEQVERPTIVHEATGARPAPSAEQPATSTARGSVRVRVSGGGFKVEPAGPGEPLSLEATYDASSHRLDERLEERADGGWAYTLEFEPTGSLLFAMLRQIVGGTSPSLTLRLPPDAPLDLELDVYRAGGMVELGGLWLDEATVNAGQGGFDLRVSEPLREPMSRFAIDARMGGMNVNDLGNASPRALDVRCSMGGLNLDLHGAWRADAEISIDASRGGVDLQLPRGLRIEGLDDGGRVSVPRDDEVPGPTLRFSTKAGTGGEISVGGRRVAGG